MEERFLERGTMAGSLGTLERPLWESGFPHYCSLIYVGFLQYRNLKTNTLYGLGSGQIRALGPSRYYWTL